MSRHMSRGEVHDPDVGSAKEPVRTPRRTKLQWAAHIAAQKQWYEGRVRRDAYLVDTTNAMRKRLIASGGLPEPRSKILPGDCEDRQSHAGTLYLLGPYAARVAERLASLYKLTLTVSELLVLFDELLERYASVWGKATLRREGLKLFRANNWVDFEIGRKYGNAGYMDDGHDGASTRPVYIDGTFICDDLFYALRCDRCWTRAAAVFRVRSEEQWCQHCWEGEKAQRLAVRNIKAGMKNLQEPTDDDKLHYTYLLVDPRDNQPFYVGKGRGKRVLAHVKEVTRMKPATNIDRYRRIAEILAAGKQVQHKVVARFATADEALEMERALLCSLDGLTNIAHYREQRPRVNALDTPAVHG